MASIIVALVIEKFPSFSPFLHIFFCSFALLDKLCLEATSSLAYCITNKTYSRNQLHFNVVLKHQLPERAATRNSFSPNLIRD